MSTKIVHYVVNTTSEFSHKLIVNGKAGDKASYSGVAVNGDYRAVITEYWGDHFPRVFKVVPVEYTIQEETGTLLGRS